MSRALFLATPLPEPLARDGRETIGLLRSGASDKEKASRAFEFIYAVADHGLTYHFSAPLASLGVGVVTRKALGVALDLALRGIRTPMRRVLDGMDSSQLAGVADALEERLYPDPHG